MLPGDGVLEAVGPGGMGRDLVLRPQLQSVDVNPESPNIPLSVAKGLAQN